MADIEKVIKNVVLGGVGAVASAVEKGGEIARTFVEKGQKTVDDNRDTIDSFKEKVQTACDSFQTMLVNLEKLSREQREELRRKLDELEKRETSGKEDDTAKSADKEEIPTIVVEEKNQENDEKAE